MAHVPFVPVLHGATADRADEVDTLTTATAVAGALRRLGYATDIVHVGLDLSPIRQLAEARPALVFNLVEALEGDSSLAHLVPAVLESCGLPYTGASAEAHRVTLSKPAVKRMLDGAGLPTPDWSWIGTGLRHHEQVIVKSATEHASLGIDAGSVVAAESAWREVRARTARFGTRFFAEAYIEGREFNLSLLGRKRPRALPAAEIVFVDYPADKPRIVDYEAKWAEGSFAYANTPRRFDFDPDDRPLLDRLRALSVGAWRLFDLTGYARVDFRVGTDGAPWILELNVNPCLAPDAGFAAAAACAGMSYDAMIGEIVSAAKRNHRSRAA